MTAPRPHMLVRVKPWKRSRTVHLNWPVVLAGLAAAVAKAADLFPTLQDKLPPVGYLVGSALFAGANLWLRFATKAPIGRAPEPPAPLDPHVGSIGC